MTTKVAVVPINDNYSAALRDGIELLGGISKLNTPAREVTIKIGLFDPRSSHHASPKVVQAIIDAFDQAPCVKLAESDNYCGKSLDRLGCYYQGLYSERVTPFSLSEDPHAQVMTIAGEEMALSSALLKPNVLISTHVLRTFSMGSILKNLFGCTPMVQKSHHHRKGVFENLLADIYEAAGGIDLAVLDGTCLWKDASEKSLPVNVLVLGRDAVAVEAVGASLAGLKPVKVRAMSEFIRRGLGTWDLKQIEIAGVSAEEFTRLGKIHKELKKQIEAEPKQLGLSKTIDLLATEGWLDTYRTADQVTAELLARGVQNAKKQLVETTLKRRLAKGLEREKIDGAWAFRKKKG